MSKFSKQHYDAIAATLASTQPVKEQDGYYALDQWQKDVENLSALFRADSAAFDPNKFLKACGAER